MNDLQVDLELQRILEKRAQELAQQTIGDDNAGESIEVVAFSIGDERYALETRFIHEVQPTAQIKQTRLPGAPEFILGLINVRGHLYSLIDIGNYLGLAPRSIPETAYILRVQGGELGDGVPLELCLLADDLPEVRSVFLDELHPAPTGLPHPTQAIVRGVTVDLLVVLDLEALLSDPGLIVHDDV